MESTASSDSERYVAPYSVALRELIHPKHGIAAFSANKMKLLAIPFDAVEHNDAFCKAVTAQREKYRGQQPCPMSFFPSVCSLQSPAAISVRPDGDTVRILTEKVRTPTPHAVCPHGALCTGIHLSYPEECYRVLPVHINAQKRTSVIQPGELPAGVKVLVHPGRSTPTQTSTIVEKPRMRDSGEMLRTVGSVEALVLAMLAEGKTYQDLVQTFPPSSPNYLSEEEFIRSAKSPVKRHQRCSHFIEDMCFRGPKCHFLHLVTPDPPSPRQESVPLSGAIQQQQQPIQMNHYPPQQQPQCTMPTAAPIQFFSKAPIVLPPSGSQPFLWQPQFQEQQAPSYNIPQGQGAIHTHSHSQSRPYIVVQQTIQSAPPPMYSVSAHHLGQLQSTSPVLVSSTIPYNSTCIPNSVGYIF